VRLHELAQDRDRSRLGNRIGVRDEHELVVGVGGAEVRVRRERARGVVLDHDGALGERGGQAVGDVGDDDELVDLLGEHGQRARELVRVPVRDHHRGDLHVSTAR
jgi:hypothetical protein